MTTEEDETRDRKCHHDHYCYDHEEQEDVTIPLLFAHPRTSQQQNSSSFSGHMDFSSIMLTGLDVMDDTTTTTTTTTDDTSSSTSSSSSSKVSFANKFMVLGADEHADIMDDFLEKKMTSYHDTMFAGRDGINLVVPHSWDPPSPLVLQNLESDDNCGMAFSKLCTRCQDPVAIVSEKKNKENSMEESGDGGRWKHDHKVDNQLSPGWYQCNDMKEATSNCDPMITKTNSLLSSQPITLESASLATIFTVQDHNLSGLTNTSTQYLITPGNTKKGDRKKTKRGERRKRDMTLNKTATEAASFLGSLRTFRETKSRLEDIRPERSSFGLLPREDHVSIEKKALQQPTTNMVSPRSWKKGTSCFGLIQSPTSVMEGLDEIRIHPLIPAQATCLGASLPFVEPPLNHHCRGEHTNSRISIDTQSAVQRSSLLSLHQQLFHSTTSQGNDSPVPFLVPFQEDSSFLESVLDQSKISCLADCNSNKSPASDIAKVDERDGTPHLKRLPRLPIQGVTVSNKTSNVVTVGTNKMDEDMKLHVSQSKKVTFNTVTVRDYETILGDNPSCHNGPSVSIGWEYEKERIYGIDIYDNKRIRWHGKTLKLSKGERENMLLKLGYSRRQLTRATFLRLKIKHDQQQSRMNTDIVAGWDEILAGVGRKMIWFIPDLKREEES
jgi:hypothetical protein